MDQMQWGNCGKRRTLRELRHVMELFRTNDVVVISYVQSLLESCGIGVVVLDENVSVLDGSIGILPRRLMVLDEDHSAAVHQLNAAGLSHEVQS